MATGGGLEGKRPLDKGSSRNPGQRPLKPTVWRVTVACSARCLQTGIDGCEMVEILERIRQGMVCGFPAWTFHAGLVMTNANPRIHRVS